MYSWRSVDYVNNINRGILVVLGEKSVLGGLDLENSDPGGGYFDDHIDFFISGDDGRLMDIDHLMNQIRYGMCLHGVSESVQAEKLSLYRPALVDAIEYYREKGL